MSKWLRRGRIKMVSFLFGILIGMVTGFGMYTILDEMDRRIKEDNDGR